MFFIIRKNKMCKNKIYNKLVGVLEKEEEEMAVGK